jgi:hypothetical protein
MGLDNSKLKILEDKLKYLYKMEFGQTKFVTSDIDIDFEQMENEDEEWILERVNIQVDFEYDGALDGDDVYYFTRDLKIMFDKFTSVIKQYTPTQEGKIVSGVSNSHVSEPMIIRVNYKYEDTHNFTLATFITYLD